MASEIASDNTSQAVKRQGAKSHTGDPESPIRAVLAKTMTTLKNNGKGSSDLGNSTKRMKAKVPKFLAYVSLCHGVRVIVTATK